MKLLVTLLMKAPETQIDATLKPLIEKWTDPPSAVQVLEVLDHCVSAGSSSGFVVKCLKIVYDIRLQKENTTHEDVVKLAHWRM